MDDCGLRFLIDVQRYIYLSRIVSSPNANGNSALNHIITSASYAWAFHSDLQEDLLGMLPCMVKNKPVWSELKIFGVGWWIRNKSVITRLFEKVTYKLLSLPFNGTCVCDFSSVKLHSKHAMIHSIVPSIS